MASYFDVVGGEQVATRAAWGYPLPTAGWEVLLDHVAVYAAAMDHCTVGDDVVEPVRPRSGRHPFQQLKEIPPRT